MADPRSRINSGLRGLSAAPPPRPTRTEIPPAVPARTPPSGTDGGPSDRTDAVAEAPSNRARPAARRRRAPSAAPSSDNVPGRPVGNKRSLVAHLPAKARDALDAEVEQLGATKGIVIMRALRKQHESFPPPPVGPGEAAGPFPLERRVRRRRAVPHRVPTTYTLWPDECEALVRVADRLDLNLSELVTDALVLRYDIALDERDR